MEVTHPLATAAPIVVLANRCGGLVRLLVRSFTAQLSWDVVALIAESQAAVEPRFNADLFATHAHAHTILCDLVTPSTKLQRVIVRDRALLDVAQDCGQVVLGAKRPVCISRVLCTDSKALIPFRQELAFQILIGLLERMRMPQPQTLHQSILRGGKTTLDPTFGLWTMG